MSIEDVFAAVHIGQRGCKGGRGERAGRSTTRHGRGRLGHVHRGIVCAYVSVVEVRVGAYDTYMSARPDRLGCADVRPR